VQDDSRESLSSALVDFQRYLLDQVPPLTVSDSIETLIQQPPELVIREIHSWALEQSRLQSAPVVDCLFHAVKKIHAFGTLKLLERTIVDQYVTRLIPLAVDACPPEHREVLRVNLEAMKNAVSTDTSTQAVNLKSQGGSLAVPRKLDAGEGLVARSARRLGLVIDRLARFLPGKSEAERSQAISPPQLPDMPREEPGAQLITMAAASATSEQELQSYIESLTPYTGKAQSADLFRVLASSVPGWEITVSPDVKVKPSAPVEAMHKIISLTKNPTESGKRFRELLMSAVEQFNSGNLSAAVSMLELAEVVIVEKKLDAGTLERIRGDAVEAINAEQLKKYTDNKAKHALLRKALDFFPSLTKESLLKDLRGEERPERRRSLLGLLEAHGEAARDAALVQLEEELNRPPEEVDTYYLRNVIYLLHRIPRSVHAESEKELALLSKSTARGQNIYVIKEAVLPLAQMKGDAAVKLLTTRLAEIELILIRKDAIYPVEEMHKLLDRIVTALARIGTPAALLTVARHAMKPNPLLGDTRARLAVLSQHDLSFDEQTVSLLIKMIREDLPTKLLGKILPKRQPPPLKVIEALSSTRSEAVEALLRELSEKYAGDDIGQTATAALATLAASGKQVGASDTRGATLTGDLQFFGLPSLMQSLADSTATGVVTLSNKSGQTSGKLLFHEGKFLDAQVAHLRGVDALYQLLELPVPGTFAFVPQSTAARSRNSPLEVMPLLFEGIRRHDELKQLSILVSDDLILKATSNKPTPDSEETDPSVVREVWLKASSGTRVAEWESQIVADAYRVRRLVSHWLEEGALQAAAPAPSAKA
jgi:hypothetical protein